MPWILVAESESRFAERIRDGLAADGWQVEIVDSVEAAEALASERPPDLLIASAELDGAAALVDRLSRRRGASGSIALMPEMGGRDEVGRAADETLNKPFTDQDLRLVVRRFAATGHAPRKPPAAAADEPRLTSKDLFGDVLAEMEQEFDPGRRPGAGGRKLPPAASPKRPARPAGPSEVDKKLEQTLSGLLDQGKAPSRPRPSATKKDAGVDDLISQTLSGLGAGKPPAKPAAPPEPPAPVSDTPALDRLFEHPAPTLGSKRPSRDLDLSALDSLARPAPPPPPADQAPAAPGADGAKSGPEGFATQKVSIPAALRGRKGATQFGQYQLLERIAVGGMAEVWKARMKGVEGFQKTVAIKKILAHLTDSSDFVTMFIDEAKLAAQLNHTNIIHIYDLGKIEDDYYIAMEYVDGRDLRTILNTAREKSKPLPLGVALLIASKLASALDHAHRMKDFEGRPLEIVHRDVSPQNVLISFEGEVKLCDFGIVKAVTKASKTQMGALKGKLQYMSPEQAWGRPVDARSDIFSLGSLLFELLTGRRLFAGDSEMSVLDAVREGRIQAPRDLDPRLPLEVNALVLRALEKEPGDRFQSAGEMQKQIDSILATLKPTPTPHELAEYMKQIYAAGAAVPEVASPPATPTPVSTPAPSTERRPSSAPRPAPSLAPEPAGAVAAEAARPATAGGDTALEAASAKGRGLLWIGLAAVVVLGLVGYLLFGRGGAETPDVTTPEGAVTGENVPAPPTVLTGEEPEAVGEGESAEAAEPGDETTETEAAGTGAEPEEVDVAKLVDGEVKKREEELRRQYEAELEKKQRELAAATAAAEERSQARPPEPEPEPAEPTPNEAEKPAESAAEPAQPEPAPTRPEPIRPARTRAEPTPPPAPPPAPKVKEGDLVEPGPGVRPPVLVSIDRPEYPPMARRLKVEGTVVMSLLVDEKGQVLDVRLVSGVQQNVGINEAALDAARSAKFRPATKEGVRVKMWYRLNVPFKL